MSTLLRVWGHLDSRSDPRETRRSARGTVAAQVGAAYRSVLMWRFDVISTVNWASPVSAGHLAVDRNTFYEIDMDHVYSSPSWFSPGWDLRGTWSRPSLERGSGVVISLESLQEVSTTREREVPRSTDATRESGTRERARLSSRGLSKSVDTGLLGDGVSQIAREPL